MNYEELQKEHNLPSKEELQKELGFISIEKDEDYLLAITKKLLEKINTYIDFLDKILQPESNIVNMQESSMFSDSERTDIFVLFKKLTYFDRLSLQVLLDGETKDIASYFNKVFFAWQEEKEHIKKIIIQAISVWNQQATNNKHDENTRYFG